VQLVSLRKPNKDLSDEELIQCIAKQNMAAFDTFCMRHHQSLWHFLQRTMQKPEQVEEVLNDALFVVWQKAASFQGQSKPTTWLFGIAYNKAMKALNRQQRIYDKEAGELLEHHESEQIPPEAVAEIVQTRETIKQLLTELSPEHRAVIELTYYNGYSCAEVSEITGCPTNTVKTRMFHARAKLKKLLAKSVANGSITYD
jgi:RNA polymerase sigma factor (sigma-70 family)